jgi:regulator of protease activity HflC (stomatin/prohibitin superfamily)
MATPVEIAAGVAVELFLIIIGLTVLYRVWGWFFSVPKRQVVQAFQRGVVLRESNVERVVGPGAYWITPKRRLLLCDVRPTPFQVPAQELLTADGMGVRISLAGEYRVVNPAFFVTESSDAFGKFYLELRQVLRLAAGEMNSHGFFSGQAQLTARMKELLMPREAQLGIEMTQLDVYEAVPVGWLREV